MKKFGTMLDCSRNAVLNIESIKKYIDILSKIGYNSLMLYTEDTYEVNNEPMFGYLRGRYSKEELKEIDSYAKSKNIELIPCIQTLAHLNAIFRWPEYASINDVNDILLVDEPKTYQLIDNMFSTLSECFSSRNVNIGMDEAHMLGRGNYLSLHGYHERIELLLRHLNKVNEIAKKYGFTIMMWSDMFYRIASNGDYYAIDNVKIDDTVKNLVPKGIKLIYWDYYHQDKKFYDKMIQSHKEFNNEICFAGGIWTWMGFAPNNNYGMIVSNPAMTSCKENNIEEVYITQWKDNGGECSFFASLPALFYAKCIYDGITSIKDIKEKFYDIFLIKWDDFMKFDLLNKLDIKDRRLLNPSKYMLYNDPFLGIFDYTIKGNESKVYAKYSSMIKRCTNRLNEYSYLASYYSSLAKVLSYKYDLGYKTRIAYQNHQDLKEIIEQYRNTIKALKDFIKYFRIAWFKENKPHGFDVEEIRLGGLLLRLESCRERLIAYQQGKINKIDELEENIVSLGRNEPIEFNAYHLNSTVNNI